MTFVQILQMALNNPEFASQIIQDPEGALRGVGIEPTPEQIKALQEAGYALWAAQCVFDGPAMGNG
jgi:hypothetical protein